MCCSGDRTVRAARLGEGEIQHAALREIRREHKVEQSALADGGDRRDPCDRLRKLAVLADNAKPSRPLRHQNPAVGQEGERPGIFEPGRDGLDLEVGFLAFDDGVLREGGRVQEQRENENETGEHKANLAAQRRHGSPFNGFVKSSRARGGGGSGRGSGR